MCVTVTRTHRTQRFDRRLNPPAVLALCGVAVGVTVGPFTGVAVLVVAACTLLVAVGTVEVGAGWAAGQCVEGGLARVLAAAGRLIAGALQVGQADPPVTRTESTVDDHRTRRVIAAVRSHIRVVHACLLAARVRTALIVAG